MTNLRMLLVTISLVSVSPVAEASAQDRTRISDGVVIQSVDSDDFSDLDALRELIGDARIVQLGESGHGADEYTRVKARLIRFLHEELGFDLVVFESSLHECAMANALVGRESRDAALSGCIFGVWHTESMRALFDYIAATRDSPGSLHLAGYDIQSSSWNWRGRPQFLHDVVARLDENYAQVVRDTDAALIESYAGGPDARRTYLRDNHNQLIAFYSGLHDWLTANEAALMDTHAAQPMPHAPLIARQTAFSLMQYVRMEGAADAHSRTEARDWAMAMNLRALAEDIYPEARIIVWAHNTHIRHNNHEVESSQPDGTDARTSGHWLRNWYGDRLFTLGLYAQSGEMTNNRRRVYPVRSPEDGTLEAQPIPDGAAGIVLTPTEDADPLWHAPGRAMAWGLFDEEMVLADQYDAILLLRETSPPDYIQWQ